MGISAYDRGRGTLWFALVMFVQEQRDISTLIASFDFASPYITFPQWQHQLEKEVLSSPHPPGRKKHHSKANDLVQTPSAARRFWSHSSSAFLSSLSLMGPGSGYPWWQHAPIRDPPHSPLVSKYPFVLKPTQQPAASGEQEMPHWTLTQSVGLMPIRKRPPLPLPSTGYSRTLGCSGDVT